MDKTIPTAANIDIEKANETLGEPVEPQCTPNSQTTWESQNETLNSPIEERIIEEDTDEESGKL
jgi:hypothetical protein